MHSKARSIRIFLPDGEPDGIRMAQIFNATIVATAFRISQIARVRNEFQDTKKPGVYLRLGENADGVRTVYVGEADSTIDRLKRWASDDPDTWSEAIAFTSTDDSLTKAHARFVEALLITAAKANPNWHSLNANEPPSTGKLPKPDEFAMRDFAEQVRMLTGALGCDVFKVAPAKPKQTALFDGAPEPAINQPQDEFSPSFRMDGAGYSATMATHIPTGECVVQEGSTIRSDATPAAPKGALKRRDEMLKSGVLAWQDGVIRFTQGAAFNSPSMAACVVSGSSVSGNVAWKLPDGTSYGEWSKIKPDAEGGAASLPP